MTMPSEQAKLRGTHPLDFLPFVQRWPRTRLRSMALTSIWGMTIGAVVTMIQAAFSPNIRFADTIVPVIVIGNSVGFTIHGGLVVLGRLLRGWPNRQTGVMRSLFYVTTVALLSIVGIGLGNAILRGRNPWHYVEHFQDLAFAVPFAFGMAVLLLIMTTVGQRRAEAEVEKLRQREDMAATAQLLAEAKLRALQAQIEPHFLYNTLANVLGLIDTQPAQALHRFFARQLACQPGRIGHCRRRARPGGRLPGRAGRAHGKTPAVPHRSRCGGARQWHCANADPAAGGKRRHAWPRTEGRRRDHCRARA